MSDRVLPRTGPRGAGAGPSKTEIAKELGISRTRVYRILDQIAQSGSAALVAVPVVKPPTAARAERLLGRQLDVAEEVSRVNQKAWEAVQLLEGLTLHPNQEPRRIEVLVKTLSKIRAQVEDQVKALDAMYDLNEAREFRRIVMEVIKQESPQVAARIRKRLAASMSLRRSAS